MNVYWLMLIALSLAAAWWLVRERPVGARRALLIFWCAVLYVLPWLEDGAQVWQRAILTLACCALLAPKLLDTHLAPQPWRNRPVAEWLRYLASPLVLCYRRHLSDPRRTKTDCTRSVLHGAIEMTLGAMLLAWAFRFDWTHWGFLAEHFVKLVACYLLLFDGAFVLGSGLLGLLSGAHMDFSRHPILARTPADFWRRYNREAGRFLYEDVFRYVSGGRPLPGILLLFLFNGLLHEYLALVMSGRLTGFQMAYFGIQGFAVAATWRRRPRGWSAALAVALTASFNVATSVLFFMSVNLFLPWYSTRPSGLGG